MMKFKEVNLLADGRPAADDEVIAELEAGGTAFCTLSEDVAEVRSMLDEGLDHDSMLVWSADEGFSLAIIEYREMPTERNGGEELYALRVPGERDRFFASAQEALEASSE